MLIGKNPLGLAPEWFINNIEYKLSIVLYGNMVIAPINWVIFRQTLQAILLM